ncbi:hypothetical protein UPYG_G00265680 [Umbra pygmaea]|uniref:Hexosyltransferase n=1 Tax=Umbra pygmaea TaxID=75934 RepID=A0ABD0WU41_UMBPY
MEWTGPGEFGKFASQTSKLIRLFVHRKYFFEIVHKQNDQGTDHMEMAWKLNKEGLKFTLISSKYISLYTDESTLRMNDVSHIPQTAASHTLLPSNQPDKHPAVDMLRVDPRDTAYQIPALDNRYLQGVLPDCSYNPSYIIKGFPLYRYQGLDFVNISYIYPNDYTRLTHMETHNTCFYSDNPMFLDRYMRMDEPEGQEKEDETRDGGILRRKAVPEEEDLQKMEAANEIDHTPLEYIDEYRDDHEDDIQRRLHKLFSLPQGDRKPTHRKTSDSDLGPESNRPVEQLRPEILTNKPNDKEVESIQSLGEDAEEVLPYEPTSPPVLEPEVKWEQTFHLTSLDLQKKRSDQLDLDCNVSGNLLLRASDALPVVKAFMDELNSSPHRRFSLVRVLNIERRVDWSQGSRYLLELELRDVNGQHFRLSRFIYHKHHSQTHTPELPLHPKMLLCNPVGFHWNPTATVHFILPVKNQARWVQQLIVDMEHLYQRTGDPNFNLIITDYSSTDMDIETALKASKLNRYQYLKLNGNFQRSAGLQAGVDLINDKHSIVFLCDLHLHFPSSIIDTVRKHCVEGYMAFAPIVMRLDCGATPRDPRGYWEVNGFGLLGIYKSDLEAAGGMNTQDFTDRWGGEDWELLDRVLQSGLEVDRIYVRNFLHHYHSKRGMWNHRILHRGS